MTTTTLQQPPDRTKDYENLVKLLSVFAEAKNRMGALENDAQEAFIGLIDERKKEYAELQQAISDSEAALEMIARDHPEWFVEAKSIKTPFGTVKLTSATSLEVLNEEVSIVLIEKHPELAEKFLRVKKVLNLEALGELDDRELKAYRIKRVKEESFSVKEAKVNLGKAVKAAVERSAK